MRSDYGTVHFFLVFLKGDQGAKGNRGKRGTNGRDVSLANFIHAQKNLFVYHSGSVEKLENVEMDRNLKDLQAFLSISSVFRTKSVIL